MDFGEPMMMVVDEEAAPAVAPAALGFLPGSPMLGGAASPAGMAAPETWDLCEQLGRSHMERSTSGTNPTAPSPFGGGGGGGGSSSSSSSSSDAAAADPLDVEWVNGVFSFSPSWVPSAGAVEDQPELIPLVPAPSSSSSSSSQKQMTPTPTRTPPPPVAQNKQQPAFVPPPRPAGPFQFTVNVPTNAHGARVGRAAHNLGVKDADGRVYRVSRVVVRSRSGLRTVHTRRGSEIGGLFPSLARDEEKISLSPEAVVATDEPGVTLVLRSVTDRGNGRRELAADAGALLMQWTRSRGQRMDDTVARFSAELRGGASGRVAEMWLADADGNTLEGWVTRAA